MLIDGGSYRLSGCDGGNGERFATVGGELLYDRYHGYVHVVSDGHTMTYDTHQTRAK